ncbi:MAG: TIGR03087 family PEP-CTERM/XrtA system glycosyltransferase [Rhodospirillaceae bacterium]
MRHLLFLAHRIPYPPNKGDKIRSWAWFRHLTERFAVHLGCFIDDDDDKRHLEVVRKLCASCHFAHLKPATARWRSLRGLLDGRALTFAYFHDAGLAAWVAAIQREWKPEIEFAFSSAVAPLLGPRHFPGPRRVIDFVDVDSAKWDQYARASYGPLAWLYAREARRLAVAERHLACDADLALLVSEPEATLFRERTDGAAQVAALSNGVDADAMADAATLGSPYPSGCAPIVFTGSMDYRPNVEAVHWFAHEVLPGVRQVVPTAGFWIVGRSPGRSVRKLATLPGVIVTGQVEDSRPYLAHADVAVAPLWIARGLQNKILEAMAAARPVVATSPAVEGIRATPGHDLLIADDAPAFTDAVIRLLTEPDLRRRLGGEAVRTIRRHYLWRDHLARLDHLLEAPGTESIPRWAEEDHP